MTTLFLLKAKLVRKHLSTRGKGNLPDLRTPQERSTETAIETLYDDYLGKPWNESFKAALADALYRDAWLEDRERYGLRSREDWGTKEFFHTLSHGEFDRAAVAAALAIRSRQPRPRRTVVDDRLSYYDSLR
jgi:hypothetical protein